MGIATATVSPSNLPNQVGPNDPQGEVYGSLSTTPISFYGNTPAALQSGAAQIAVPRGNQFGEITTYATSQNPAAVASNTSAEALFTVMSATANQKIASTDIVYVNKPTAQAGLGVGAVRATSTANIIGVNFSNFTTSSIIVTSPEKYGVVAIRGFPTLTAALSPAAVQVGTTVEQQFTVTGLRAGELVQVSKPTAQAGLDIVGCRVVSANTVGITFATTQLTTPVVPTAGETYTFFSLGGLDAAGNTVSINEAAPVLVTVATTTTAEQAFTVTGLAVTDTVVGVSKPTAQAGLGVVGWRVSAINSMGITFANVTGAAITPTSTDTYALMIFRPNPVAPMVLYQVPLNPTTVAANTSAEQAFTVTGLVAGSMVWVNKPSLTPGIGIAGVRVSGANSLAINFCNTTSQVIDPPQETYLIGNFQQPVPDNFSAWTYSVSPAQQQMVLLANAIRAALAQSGGTGLIVGQ